MHVDAYRVGAGLEVDDLDLDATVDDAVTVVEWGEGKVERLSPDRLEVLIDRPAVGSDPAPRRVRLRASGPRWDRVDLQAVARLA